MFRIRRQQLGLLQLSRRIAQNPPTAHQEDFLLAHFLRRRVPQEVFDTLRNRAGLFANPPPLHYKSVFYVLPSCRLAHFRELCRFLAGKADFARVHAHYYRRSALPALTLDPSYTRMCLFCFARDNVVTVDAEWHFLFGCPSSADWLGRLTAFGAVSPTTPTTGSPLQVVSMLFALRRDADKLGDFPSGLWLALRLRQRRFDTLPLSSLDVALSQYHDRRPHP